MKRPAFQFYPGDWRSNAKLRRCSWAERAIWLEVICLMHDSDDYGILRWPLREIAQAVGCRLADLKSLVSRDVLKGADPGQRCVAYHFTPTHAGKDGEAVTLVPEQGGPIWYSSRMVRDEYLRQVRGRSTRFDHQPKVGIGDTPKGGMGVNFGVRSGDGASASSSVHVPTAYAVGVPDGTPAGPPDCPHGQIIALYHELLPECPRVIEWNEGRRGYLRARWREKAKPNGVTQGYRTVEEGLAWWRTFFLWCAKSQFLTGKVNGKADRPPFTADLEWLIRPTNFARVSQGKYHDATSTH